MKILVGLPTHSETITVATAQTLMNLQELCRNRAYDVVVSFYSSAMISDVRNAIVSEFMSGGHDRLFFLDSDQGIPSDLISSMIDYDKPVTGCFYPRRKLSWERIPGPVQADSMKDVIARAQEFVGDLVITEGEKVQFKVDRGFAKARYIGTGCFLVTRACIEAMAKHYPELHGRGYNNIDYPKRDAKWNYGFFNPYWSEIDNRHLAEDYAFCERWRRMDGEIYANVDIPTTHIGRYTYEGDYISFLKAGFAAKVETNT